LRRSSTAAQLRARELGLQTPHTARPKLPQLRNTPIEAPLTPKGEHHKATHPSPLPVAHRSSAATTKATVQPQPATTPHYRAVHTVLASPTPPSIHKHGLQPTPSPDTRHAHHILRRPHLLADQHIMSGPSSHRARPHGIPHNRRPCCTRRGMDER
jgi:hypothetical protein